LKAIWQIEQQVNLETGTGTFSSRNSFVGLSGGFGTVKLGNMDTIYKEYGDTFGMLGVSSGNFVSPSNVLSHIGVGNNRAARFHERRPNAAIYETPQFGGVTAGIMYGPDEAKNNPPAAGAPALDANLYSYGVKYDSERFYVSLHQERHNDFFGGSNNVASGLRNNATPGAHSRDTATRLSGELRMGIHRLVGDIAWMEWKESGQAAGTKFVSYKHTNWAIGWEARWGGPWRTGIHYIQGGEGTCTLTVGDCSTTGLKGTQINLGVGYQLDRQTMLFALASRLTNGKSALYDNWDASDPARGGDTTQAAVGISYTF
jgi:predicted porin